MPSGLHRLVCAFACSILAGGCEPRLPRETPDPPRAEREAQPTEPGEEGTDIDLLQFYAARKDPVAKMEIERSQWSLPHQSKRLVAVLMILAARDDLEHLSLVLTPDAKFGLPDPRMIGALPIFPPGGDRGELFLRRFREAARRLPRSAGWDVFQVVPAVEQYYRSGAEPMWSTFFPAISPNNPWARAGSQRGAGFAEVLILGAEGLMFREVIYGGEARIDYVGFWPEGAPGRPPSYPAWVGAPPPLSPPLRRDMVPSPG